MFDCQDFTHRLYPKKLYCENLTGHFHHWLFAVFSFSAIYGCSKQADSRYKQQGNPQHHIAAVFRLRGNGIPSRGAGVVAITCLVVAGLRRLDIVGGSRRIDGKLRSTRSGFGNDSQRVFAHRKGFQIGSL